MSRPQCISPINGDTNSHEAIYAQPDDPVDVLPSTAPQMRRKMSFMSSPLSPMSDGQESTKKKPIVKLIKTQPNLNGRYAWVHAYYQARDRYAVTLLDAENTSKSSTTRNPALLHYGQYSIDSGKTEEEYDNSSHTIFVPPSTIGHLTLIDDASLYLQYLAMEKLSSPQLALLVKSLQQSIQGMMDALPPLSWGVFTIIILPWLLSLLTKIYTQESSQSHHPRLLSIHTSDILTLAAFLTGTNAIARFIHSEYRAVKQKAEAMQLSRSFTTSELLEYRIDYYFSTSKWAKVAFLLSLTFMLIAFGAGLLAVFLEDHSISNAAWMSWTFVADPGERMDYNVCT